MSPRTPCPADVDLRQRDRRSRPQVAVPDCRRTSPHAILEASLNGRSTHAAVPPATAHGGGTTMTTTIPPLDPGERLLCGPGPSNVHPKVLEATAAPDERASRPGLLGRPGRPRRRDARAVAPRRPGAHDRALLVGHVRDGGRVHEPDRPRRHRDQLPLGLLRLAPERLRAPRGRRRGRAHRRLRAGRARSTGSWRPSTAHPEAKVVSVVHAETSTGAEFPLEQLAAAMQAPPAPRRSSTPTA